MQIHKSVVIAAAIVGLASAPALADNTLGVSIGNSATTSGGVSVPGVDIGSSGNAKANANVAVNADFGQVMSSVQGAKLGAAKIKAITKVKNVNVVNVNEIATAENKTALDQAVTKNKSDIASLHSALSSNTAVKTALADATIDVEAVVAANITSDGVLTVYVL